MPAPVLRDYQARAIELARAARRAGHRRILLQAPTGSGKTVIATAIIQNALGAFNGRVLVVAHRKELVDQFWAQLHLRGITPGILRGDDERTDPAAPVQVGTVQTLTRRTLPPADLVFVDEAHRAPGDSYSRILEAYPKATVFGLTATPARLDGQPLREHFDVLVPVASYSDLIAQGAIAAPIVYGPERAPNLRGVRRLGGDFNVGQLQMVMSSAHVVGDVVATWKRLAEGRSTVLFAVGVEHSKRLIERFEEAGVRCAHLDGETPEQEREQILYDLETRKIQLVSNVGVLCEGWDQPSVKCVIMARPTLSLTLWMQCAGRILRPWGDLPPLLLDHSGNVDRHGLPHEDREWSLDGKAKRRSEIQAMMCGACFAYVERMPCPLCGHASPAKPRKIKEAEGELVQKSGRKAIEPTGDERRDYFNEQAERARTRGFKPGFAAAKFKEKYGEWPPWGWSESLKRDHAADTFWQERLAKRERERAYWQDRQAAAEQLKEDASNYVEDPERTEEPETFDVSDL